MTTRNHLQRHVARLAVVLALVVVLLRVWPSSLFGADKAKAPASTPAEANTQNLVWPPPPDAPRIRWVGQFSKFTDVTGEQKKKKKPSWFERLAGVKQQDEELERGLADPYGIAVDSKKRIYVAEKELPGVVIFDRQAHTVEVRNASALGGIRLPLGIALDAHDRLFVSDAELAAISCFNPDGSLAARFGSKELVRPAGIAIDRKRNRLYVADVKGDKVNVYSTETFKLLETIGGPGTPGGAEPATFALPSNVAVDRRGYLYVSDSFNFRVQVFNRRGRFVRAFGSLGDAPGQFARPKGLAVDSEGHIYVVDAVFNNFQIFDQEGQILLFVGTFGEQPGQFILPAGIFIDENDVIYTTEGVHGRVQIFQYISQPDTAVKRR